MTAPAALGARSRVLRRHHPIGQPAAAVGAPEAQPDQRHVAAAGVDQALEVGLALVTAHALHADVAGAQRGPTGLAGRPGAPGPISLTAVGSVRSHAHPSEEVCNFGSRQAREPSSDPPTSDHANSARSPS